MILALVGTLPFIATLWLLVVLGAAILDESGAKIVSALKGEPLRQPLGRSTTRHRARRYVEASERVTASLRAAA